MNHRNENREVVWNDIVYIVESWGSDFKATPKATYFDRIQDARANKFFRRHEGFESLDDVEAYVNNGCR